MKSLFASRMAETFLKHAATIAISRQVDAILSGNFKEELHNIYLTYKQYIFWSKINIAKQQHKKLRAAMSVFVNI